MYLPVQSPGESEVFCIAGDEIRKRKRSCVTDALWESIRTFSGYFHDESTAKFWWIPGLSGSSETHLSPVTDQWIRKSLLESSCYLNTQYIF